MKTAEIIKKLKNTARKDSEIFLTLRKNLVINGQHPYAVVVACSDSRVIPEDIFMTGLGELFVIRVAGNVVADHQLGSIEYAVEHLGCPLVIILGHTHCGAIGAAIEGGAESFIKTITDDIKLAIGDEKDDRKASCLNVEHVVRTVRDKIHVDVEGFQVLGAVYDIENGQIEWLEV